MRSLRDCSSFFVVYLAALCCHVCSGDELCVSGVANLNATGSYVVNCTNAVAPNITIAPPPISEKSVMNVHVAIHSPFIVITIPNVSSSRTVVLTVSLDIFVSCRDADSPTFANSSDVGALPLCGNIVVHSALVRELSVSFHADTFLSSPTTSALLWISPTAVIREMFSVTVVGSKIVGKGDAPRLVNCEGTAPATRVALLPHSAIELTHIINSSTVAPVNYEDRLGFLSLLSTNITIEISNATLTVSGVGTSDPSASWPSVIRIASLSSELTPDASVTISIINGSSIEYQKFSAVFHICPRNASLVVNTSSSTFVRWDAMSTHLSGADNATALQISETPFVVLAIDVAGGSVYLTQGADLLQIGSSSGLSIGNRSSNLTSDGVDVVVENSSISLTNVTCNLLGGAAPITLRTPRCLAPAATNGSCRHPSVVFRHSNITLQFAEFVISNSHVQDVWAPGTFVPWLLHSRGSNSSVGAHNLIRLRSIFIVVVDASTEAPMVFPMFAWDLATSEPPPLWIWHTTTTVVSDCTNRVYLGGRTPPYEYGDLDVTGGSALRGVPPASISNLSQCITPTTYDCPLKGIIPFTVRGGGIHLVYCSGPAVTVNVEMTNETRFVQLQVMAGVLYTITTTIHGSSPTTTAAFLRANAAISIIVLSSVFNAANSQPSLVNVSVRELAVVFTKGLAQMEMRSLLSITAPPQKRLVLRVNDGILQLATGIVMSLVTVIVVSGAFPEHTHIAVHGSNKILLPMLHRVILLSPSPAGIPQMDVDMSGGFLEVDPEFFSSSPCAGTTASLTHSFISIDAATPKTPVRLNLVMSAVVVTVQAACSAVFAFHNTLLHWSNITIHAANVSMIVPPTTLPPAEPQFMMFFLMDNSNMSSNSTLMAATSVMNVSSIMVIVGNNSAVVSSEILLQDTHVRAPVVPLATLPGGCSILRFDGAIASIFQVMDTHVVDR